MKTLPEITEGQYLELTYVNHVGTKTINSLTEPSINYRFSSPGNVGRAAQLVHVGSRKRVVMSIEEAVDPLTVYWEDALRLTEFIEMNHNIFVLNVVDIPVEEIVEEGIEEITSDVIEETTVEDDEGVISIEMETFDIDIDVSISINAMKELIDSPLLTFTNETFLELIEEEKQGKNRQTMIKLLESNL